MAIVDLTNCMTLMPSGELTPAIVPCALPRPRVSIAEPRSELVGSIGRCGYDPGAATPRFACAEEPPLFVPRQLMRSVVFIGVLDENGIFLPKATGFFVNAGEGDFMFPHLVTAEHVYTGLVQKDFDLVCRVNLVNGGVGHIKLDQKMCWIHPDTRTLTDVAVFPLILNPQQVDRYRWKVYHFEHGWRRQAEKGEIDVGDEIVIVGLFKSHHGQRRNIPIVRTGNLAAFPEEPVFTLYCGFTDAYLVEAGRCDLP
jgi:hypothetical protein